MSFSTIKITSLQRFSLNFAANIIAAFYMLVGSVRAFLWVKPSFGQFFCFLLLALLSNVLFGWLASDMGSEFNEQGLISYLVWPMIMLVAGVLIAKRSENHALTFIPVILWLTADTFLVLLQSLIQFLGMQNLLPSFAYSILPLLFMLLFVWQTAALLLIFAKKLYWNWWERGLMLVGAIALLVVWQNNVTAQPIFKIQEITPTIDEVVFYAQPTILEERLSAINEGVLGVSEWYFLGVAGYGGQNVFASEISKAKELFDIRFGLKGRSVALLNNQYTWLDEPVATRTSIERSLNAIGQKMNAEEDVLFLVISSHGVIDENGVPTGEMVMDNPPLDLADIDGEWLKDTLDKSGIKWRVIVLSSCYSGAMIENLMSPTTVIIAASKADKASFGCTDDADMTYFGRAFFEEGLRDNDTFERVFNQAKLRVAEREALMGFVASEPQMAVGVMMGTTLPEFEKMLFELSGRTETLQQ